MDAQGWNEQHPVLIEAATRRELITVVEIGVWKGASVIKMATAIRDAGIDGVVVAVEKFGVAADVIHLDGCHDYEVVAADLRAGWERLKPGGLLIGDDYNIDEAAGRPGAGRRGRRVLRRHGPALRACERQAGWRSDARPRRLMRGRGGRVIAGPMNVERS